MFLGLDVVLYILGYLFIVFVTLFRLIVLCSRCRVNRSTNLSVFLYYVIFLFAFTVRLGFRVLRSQPVGHIPTLVAFTPHHHYLVYKAQFSHNHAIKMHNKGHQHS